MDVKEFIPTKGSKLRGIDSTVHTESFTSHKAKKKDVIHKSHLSVDSKTKDEFNIKQAKREILKFGMSGLDNQKQEEYKIQLAIKLGAKPKKNNYQNYAILQEKKKIAQTKPLLQHLGKVILQNTSGKRRNRNHLKNSTQKSGIIGQYGKVVKKS